MKTIPPPCPHPETGPKYWRSLDELAATPEFQQWLEKEFPVGASEFSDGPSRRNFIKIMASSFALMGLGATGCRRPVETIVPFTRVPEDYVHGAAQFYATSMPTRTGAIPLLVKSHEGRPIKIEGNPDHPDSNGGTNVWAQASILDLYDVDRAKRFVTRGAAISRQQGLDYLKQVGTRLQGNGGAGVAFLIESNTSTSRDRLKNYLQQRLPQAKWFTNDTTGADVAERAATQAFGQPVRPFYQLDKASIIVSLDADFVNQEEDNHRLQRGFTAGRKILKASEGMNRLYVIESMMTLTGANADHRLPVSPSAVAQKAAELYQALQNGGQAEDKWISECAKDLLRGDVKGKIVVLAGQRQPVAVHMLALAMNNLLGGIGTTVALHQVPARPEGTLQQLAEALNAGQVETLIVAGGNPVYSAPADLNWAATQRKAKEIIRLGYYEDETTKVSDVFIPEAHYLESWGDARTTDGTYVPVQPLIQPLYGALSEIEFLARVTGAELFNAYDIVRDTFRALVPSASENVWKQFLHDGYLPESAAKGVQAQLNSGAVTEAATVKLPAPPNKDALEIVFFRDPKVDDGRFANNGWLQELPDPVTKITWENVILVSAKTATALGFDENEFDQYNRYAPHAKISVGGKEVTGTMWVQPGMPDNVAAVAIGYGRKEGGRIGKDVGFNANLIRTAATPHFASGAKITKAEGTSRLSCTQNHWAMEGRPIVREANLDQFAKHPKFAKALDLEEPPIVGSIYRNPLENEKENERIVHQWGMSIDLNACTGCSSCVIACQSENNIPIVGKEQVWRQREMHWMRIDRYYAGTADKDNPLGNPQVVTQPMLCQHCEAAPCENVCPVNATTHDEEGLNLMVYNRCVGTRYCSNNCPYKVRRFNFFDWHKRPMDERKYPFYQSPLTSRTDGEFDIIKWAKNPDKATRLSDEEWDLKKLVNNPDVTVRMRGVMEKCTFCVQRIEGGKIAQKVKAGASADVQVKEGQIKTACQQACPNGAIEFGNLKDPNSNVSKLRASDRTYQVLDYLYTRPRVTYLARVRNPNRNMPDFHEYPLTTEEYKHSMHIEGNPYAGHGGGHGNPAEHATPASAGHGDHGKQEPKKGAH